MTYIWYFLFFAYFLYDFYQLSLDISSPVFKHFCINLNCSNFCFTCFINIVNHLLFLYLLVLLFTRLSGLIFPSIISSVYRYISPSIKCCTVLYQFSRCYLLKCSNNRFIEEFSKFRLYLFNFPSYITRSILILFSWLVYPR